MRTTYSAVIGIIQKKLGKTLQQCFLILFK